MLTFLQVLTTTLLIAPTTPLSSFPLYFFRLWIKFSIEAESLLLNTSLFTT